MAGDGEYDLGHIRDRVNVPDSGQEISLNSDPRPGFPQTSKS